MHNLAHVTAIVLAGGFGTRLHSVVSDVPKPMAPIGGRPFLEYQLDYLGRSGIGTVVLSTGYKAAVIKTHFGDNWNGIHLRYSHEEEPLGTGGAMIKAARLVPDAVPVLVMNGDTYFPVSLRRMLVAHQQREATISMAMFETDVAGRYSQFEMAADGRLSAAGPDRLSPYKSGGIYIFSPNIVSDLKDREEAKLSFEDDLTPSFLEQNLAFYAFLDDCPFIDIGVPQDYRRAAGVITAHDHRDF
ncbi:nucleotidyltransferase family protein [bacterium]|nr:nucleotidyltransferase family protein [bacterium]